MEKVREFDLIYVYDGSFDGLFSAIHGAYYNRENPKAIVCENEWQQELFCEVRIIENDSKKAKAVRDAISKKISPNALFNIHRVFLSNEPTRSTIIFNYVKIGFKMGAKVDMFLSDETVSNVKRIALRVSREACRMREFVRFSKMENGVMFAKISPDNNVLSMICPYFADRLCTLPWVICDTKRSIAAIYDTKKWIVTEYEKEKNAREADGEMAYKHLWKTFYDTISIESRKNERLQMQCMPKKYRKNMTEFMGA